jgi:hypothetical protein
LPVIHSQRLVSIDGPTFEGGRGMEMTKKERRNAGEIETKIRNVQKIKQSLKNETHLSKCK